MKTLVRCRACGYVMSESDVGDLCPACGLPKTVFEPYKDKVSESRRNLVDLHVHPIVVHFPPVLAIAIAGGLVLSPVLSAPWQASLRGAIELSILLMPLCLLAALASGFFDGRLRFKKVTTPLLRKKMLAGGICLLLSLGLCGVWATTRLDSTGLLLVLSVGCLACNIYLGRVGATLMDAILPG